MSGNESSHCLTFFVSCIHTVLVYENICFPLYLQKRQGKREEIYDLLKMLELEEKIDVYPEQLSGGQQQRVAIGRAFISNPQVILAGELTGNLDEAKSNQIVDVFLKCKERYQYKI